MAYTDFDKLKTFFLALNKSGYHPDRMDPKIITPKDKAYCFNLLREKIPELKDKTDNDLIEFLKDPKKVKERILGKFAVGEGFELTKILDEKPIIAEGVGGQPSDQAAQAETPPAGTGGSWGGGMPSMPSITAPAIHPVYRTKPPVPETPKPDIIKPTSRFNFSSFKSRMSNFAKTAQNFAGRANPWLKTNLGRVGRGLTQSVLPSGANFLGRTGLKAINYGGNFLSNLSNARSRLSTTSKSLSPKNLGPKRALLIFGAVSFLIFFMGALGGMGGNTSTGEAAPAPMSTTTIVASCPVLNGAITTPSYQKDPVNGHCSDSYSQVEACNDSCRFTGRKSKSIDVATGGPNGKDVILPKIEGQEVNWQLLNILCSAHGQTYPNCGSVAGETGLMYLFETVPQNPTDPKWDLQLVHMLPNSSLNISSVYPSGTILGKTDITIVHITIGKNIANPLSPGSPANDCDTGWIPADSICPNP